MEELDKDIKKWWNFCEAHAARQQGTAVCCVVCGLTDAQLTARSVAPGTVVCNFFLQGKCKRGAKCKFLHDNTQTTEAGPVPDSKMLGCEECCAVLFCSEACRDQQAAAPVSKAGSKAAHRVGGTHTEFQCHELQLFAACKGIIDDEEMQKGHPQWLAYTDLEEPYPLVPAGKAAKAEQEAEQEGWNRYVEVRAMPVFSAPFLSIVTETLSFPVTLVHALQQLAAHVQKCDEKATPALAALASKAAWAEESEHLTIHLLGAEWDTEAVGEDKWMEVLHLLPCYKSMSIVMVGPQLPTEVHGQAQELCVQLTATSTEEGPSEDDSMMAGRPYEVAFFAGTYEDLVADPSYTKPDLAVAFHSGVADFRQDWSATMKSLVETDIPLLMTHYHQWEAEFDSRTMAACFNANMLVQGDRNPYRSLLPIPDPLFDGEVYYTNQFYSIAWGAQLVPNTSTTTATATTSTKRKSAGKVNSKKSRPKKKKKLQNSV